MKLGDKVHCTAYAQKMSGGVNIFDFSHIPFKEEEKATRTISYYDSQKKEFVYIDEKDFTDAVVEKFCVIEKEFDGIYVGTTKIATQIEAVFEYSGVGNYIQCRSVNRKDFAIVYYASGKKRLVPIEYVKERE